MPDPVDLALLFRQEVFKLLKVHGLPDRVDFKRLLVGNYRVIFEHDSRLAFGSEYLFLIGYL